MKISLNSKPCNTRCNDINELKIERNFSDGIVIYDGFIIDENLSLREDASIFFIKKGEIPEPNLLKGMMSARNTEAVNNKLKGSSVAIAGLGGLGSNIAISLARVGVQRLLLVDYDVVEPSNLNRQHYFLSHLWMKKTDALKEQISFINPFIKVECVDAELTPSNVCEILKDEKIICEAFDKASSKAMILNAISDNFNDKIIISASGMAGFGSSNDIKTTKFGSNIYICGDKKSGAQINTGLMAPRVMICAAHQANMILRVILDEFEV